MVYQFVHKRLFYGVQKLRRNLQIAQIIAETYDDPLAFVQLAYPWGEPGELARFTGPDQFKKLMRNATVRPGNERSLLMNPGLEVE